MVEPRPGRQPGWFEVVLVAAAVVAVVIGAAVVTSLLPQAVRDLIFNSPRFIETGSGKIPVPPETGIPSLRGSWLTEDKWMSVKRGEIESAPQRVTEIFLQDGDEISTSQQQQIPRQPQPRVGESPPNQAIPSR